MRENLRKVYFRTVDSSEMSMLNARDLRKKVNGPRLESILPSETIRSLGASDASLDLGTFSMPRNVRRPGVEILHFSERQNPHSGFVTCQNPSDSIVMIPSGTLITGGWQNRYFSEFETVPHGTKELPVLCAEPGRFEGSPEFSGTSVLPAFLRNRFSQPRDQLRFWDEIMESLILSDSPSHTLSPVEFSGIAPSINLPEDFFGGYSLNDSRGMSTFRFSATRGNQETTSDLKIELQHWDRLKKNARSAREYFRIFDEKLRVGVRCSADGRAMKGIDGKYFVFRYAPEDLRNGFTPPLEEPPGAQELEFPSKEHFASTSEWWDSLKASRLEPIRTSGDIRFFSLHNADCNITGNVATIKDEPVLIDATAFRAYAF